MRTYEFTLYLKSLLPESGLCQELEDALYSSGCEDALLGSLEGILYLDFSREAESFPEALNSAVQDIENSKVALVYFL